MPRPKPIVLAICDGFGIAPDHQGNAITNARTPNIDYLIENYPVMPIAASGTEVGLMYGEMGNSEVGHLNIGAGRVYYQTLPRLYKSIENKTFFKNETFLAAIEHAKKNKSALHYMGLVSPGNIHAAQDHLFALIELAAKEKVKELYIHAFLDGRDTGEKTATDFITILQEKMKKHKVGKIATMGGRYFGMDRDNRWDRIEKSYRTMVDGVAAETFTDPIKAIEASYAKEVYDEQFVPTIIVKKGKKPNVIKDGDACIFFNFRPDRARQITKAFTLPSFDKFQRTQFNNLFFVTMTEYEKNLPVKAAFPPVVIDNCLAEVISKAGLRQFHVAETEKYAHVTFFLNGTVEDAFMGEDRKIVPSPKVASYDEAPEMSAAEVTKEVVKAIEGDAYDFIVLNFANTDMVGHTGKLESVIKGVEAVDKGLGEIANQVLARDGVMFITADHGNAEDSINLQTGNINKEHTTNPVPLFVIANKYAGMAGPSGDAPNGDLSLLPTVGMLADVAPTILKHMEVDRPPEMTGRPLM